MSNVDNLKNVITSLNKGVSYPALKLVKNDPETAALISKLIHPKDPADRKLVNKNGFNNIDQSQIQAVSNSIKTRLRDNENISQLFPDIELGMQILTSSVLSPKDMVKTEIIYKSKENILPAQLVLKLNTIVTKHFENYYNIKKEMPSILREALFTSGAYVKVVIPESIVDEIINSNQAVTTESLKEIYTPDMKIIGMGFLGNFNDTKSHALENFVNSTSRIPSNEGLYERTDNNVSSIVDKFVTITDNFNMFKLPEVIKEHTRQKVKLLTRRNRFATEANNDSKKLSEDQLNSLLFKNNLNQTQNFVILPSSSNTKRKSIGRPLSMKLPTESVIPVYVPGDEKKHIGYFVLMDDDGNPVTLNKNTEYMQGLGSMLNQDNAAAGMSSLLISKAKRNLINTNNNVTIDHITKIYASIVENNLIESLRKGVYGNNLEISNNEEIYRIMLARSFAGKYTKLVFIPAEYVTYFAFNYFENGVGKSYLDSLKIITSLRAILLFSKVMAMTKNSIALTHVNMTIDPNDPDPQKTIEMSIHEIVKMRQQYFPLGINSPTDLVDWIQKAGFEFTFEGHPGIPSTKFEFETKNIQHTLPDNDLEELLRKQTYMSFGLSPETVDNGFNAEFATTVVSNNILLSKRVTQLQDVFTIQLTDHCHKLLNNDNIFLKEIKEALIENKGLVEKILTEEEKVIYNKDSDRFLNDLIERYILNLELELPKPDEVTVDTQLVAFDKYSDAIDKTIDHWVSTDIITSDLGGDISSYIDTIKNIAKAHFLRRWMSDNNFMSELSDLVTSDDDGKATINLFEVNRSHIEGIIRSSIEFVNSLKGVKDAANIDVAKLGGPAEDTGSSSGSDSSDSGSGGLDDSFDMGGLGELDASGSPTPDEDEQLPADNEDKTNKDNITNTDETPPE